MSGIEFVPVGYMYKQIASKPEFLKAESVTDIYSVSACISDDFSDWIIENKNNGYWFFDSPMIMTEIASSKQIDLSPMKLFFYKASALEWDEDGQVWCDYNLDNLFHTNIITPEHFMFEGYDIVSYSTDRMAECSPLSCNHLCESFAVNSHCLLESIEKVFAVIHSGELAECEPGPYRVFEVYSVIE